MDSERLGTKIQCLLSANSMNYGGSPSPSMLQSSHLWNIPLESVSASTLARMRKKSWMLLLLLSHFSRVRLCDPIDGSPPGSPVPGILQARTLEWVAISFSNAWKWQVKVNSLSRVRLLATPWTAAHQAPPSMDFLGKSTGVGCHCLLRKSWISSHKYRCTWHPHSKMSWIYYHHHHLSLVHVYNLMLMRDSNNKNRNFQRTHNKSME